MSQTRALDIVVFGATGFTGGLVAQYLSRHGGSLRWALAGRDLAKLEKVRAGLGGNAAVPELIVADAADDRALAGLAARTRVVLTTVGPYVRHGEPIVRACAEAGTHYVDLTGEPPFVALTRQRYHARAVESRAKIVHACGFDSIPHDLGALFTLRTLRRRMNDAERATASVRMRGVVRAGGTISGGTWHSALEIMGAPRAALAKRIDGRAAGDTRKVRSLPRAIGFDDELGLWIVPMPTIDPLVVLASARSLPEYGPDFRYGHFVGLRHWYQVAALVGGASSVFLLAQLGPTRRLLQKLRTPGQGPDEATRQRGWFRVTFSAEGGAHRVRCQVRGGDPGYGETAKMIAEAALTLAHDEQQLPESYGVVTTAAALGERLIERLMHAGIAFEELPDAHVTPAY
jgi:short subunit dehydrogenase-like uncharacterized protein